VSIKDFNDNDLPIRTIESYEAPSIASGTDEAMAAGPVIKATAGDFASGWYKAAQGGAHVSPELRKALESSGVPADQVVSRVNEMVARAGYRGADAPDLTKRVFKPLVVS